MQFRESPDPKRGALQDRGSQSLVLLVEDDFVLRSSLSELLALEGFRVECCADGGDAFRRLHHPPKPAVILLDIMLPHVDGFEFRAMQRKVPGFATIPVVVISAHDLDRGSLDELDLPVSFRKPLDVTQLLATLRDIPAPPA
jgi:CheY-like chemotaxis protein